MLQKALQCIDTKRGRGGPCIKNIHGLSSMSYTSRGLLNLLLSTESFNSLTSCLTMLDTTTEFLNYRKSVKRSTWSWATSTWWAKPPTRWTTGHLHRYRSFPGNRSSSPTAWNGRRPTSRRTTSTSAERRRCSRNELRRCHTDARSQPRSSVSWSRQSRTTSKPPTRRQIFRSQRKRFSTRR